MTHTDRDRMKYVPINQIECLKRVSNPRLEARLIWYSNHIPKPIGKSGEIVVSDITQPQICPKLCPYIITESTDKKIVSPRCFNPMVNSHLLSRQSSTIESLTLQREYEADRDNLVHDLAASLRASRANHPSRIHEEMQAQKSINPSTNLAYINLVTRSIHNSYTRFRDKVQDMLRM